ncbi:MAG: VOC family protein [Paenibacillaceae bacterium]
MYKELQHVALVVQDLEKERHFYEEILGFQVSKDRPDFDFDGIWYHMGSSELHLVVPNVPSVGVESELGKGSLFYCTLPIYYGDN